MTDATDRFHGLFSAVHTPFNRAGRLDASVVGRQVELLLEAGADGVFLCGTAGEGHSLTVAERKALLEAWVGVTEGSVPILVHVGHNSIRSAVRLAEHAAMAGATGIASMAPTFYKPDTLEQLIEYLAAIAVAAPGLPFFFYDAPDLNGVRFPLDQVLEWGRLRIPTLVGAKFTSRDLATFARCQRLDGGFRVFVGYEDVWLPSLSLGADAAIGATMNFAGPAYARIQAAVRSGDRAAARVEHAEVLRLVDALQRFGVVRASKALMALLGVDCGDVRLPLRPMHDVEVRELYEAVRGLGVFARPLATPAEIGR